MSGFQKYLHLERYGTDGVDGITIGQCHIFPKLDGTNASFWYEQGQWFYAPRNLRKALRTAGITDNTCLVHVSW